MKRKPEQYDKEMVAFSITFTFSFVAFFIFTNIFARICEAVACIGSAVMIIFLTYLHYHYDNHQKKKKGCK